VLAWPAAVIPGNAEEANYVAGLLTSFPWALWQGDRRGGGRGDRLGCRMGLYRTIPTSER